MSQDIISSIVRRQESMIPDDATDDLLVELWLHTKKVDKTQKEYRRDIAQFREYLLLPLRDLKLPDIQRYEQEMKALPLSSSTIARKIMAVKSLLAFAQVTGYTQFNVGTMIKAPEPEKKLAERILEKSQVLTMIFTEQEPRNHLILRLFYATGIRVSELCRLTWRNIQPNRESGQVTVYGKRSKTRTVLIPKDTYEKLKEFRQSASLDAPVFPSRGGGRGHNAGGHLDPSQVHRIVQQAAKRVGITDRNVSPHWLRHAHASHALDNGAPISLVKETMGHEDISTTAGYTHARPGTSSSQYIDGV